MHCSACTAALPIGAKYCGGCGAQVGSLAVANRRVVTVVFVDIATVAAAGAQTQVHDAIHTRIHETLAAVVQNFGGSVLTTSDYAVLLVFGFPDTHEDDAERAVRSAWEMQRRARRLADVRGAATVRLRIAVHTGLVVSRPAGKEVKDHTQLVGDALESVHQLGTLCEPGKVVVSTETHNLTNRKFRYQVLKTRSPNWRHPDPVYVLAGCRARTGSKIDTSEKSLVGRQSELEALALCWEQVQQGAPHLVILYGEPGIGKSALSRKFLESPAMRLAQTCWVRCQSWQQTLPYAMVGNFLLALMRLPEHTEPEDSESSLKQYLSGVFPNDDEKIGPLHHILSHGNLAHHGGLEPRQLRTAAFLALCDTVVQLGRKSPFAVVFENMHWADEASREWFDRLKARLDHELRPLPILIIAQFVSMDNAVALESTGGMNATRLEIKPLSRDNAVAMAATMLGAQAETLPGPVREVLNDAASRSGGNPFYLNEMVVALESTGALVREGSSWRVDVAAQSWKLPTTIHAAIGARLDRIAPAERHFLHLASVLGPRFDRALVAHIAEADPDLRDIEGAIPGLLAAHILEEVRVDQSYEELAFTHPVFLEVAYGSMLEDRRRKLHHLVGSALEAKVGSSSLRYAAILAHHFSQVEDTERTANYLVKAAQHARAAYANADARKYHRKALEWLDRAGEDATLPAREDLLLDLATEETALGNYDEALALLDARWDLAPETPKVLRAKGTALELKGDMAGALASFRRALVLAGNDGLESARAMAAAANIRRRLGDFQEALVSCQTALVRLSGLGLAAEAAYVHGVMGFCKFGMGDPEAALRDHSEALRLREGVGDVDGVASSLNNLGIVSTALRLWAEAEAYQQRSLTLYQRLGSHAMIGAVLNNIGERRYQQRDLDGAERALVEALKISQRLGYAGTTIAALGNLAAVWLVRDEPKRALELVDQCLALVFQTGMVEELASVRHLRGRTLNQLGRREEAHAEYDDAKSLAASAGNSKLWELLDQESKASDSSG